MCYLFLCLGPITSSACSKLILILLSLCLIIDYPVRKHYYSHGRWLSWIWRMWEKKQRNYLSHENWCKYNIYWFLLLLLPFSDKGFHGSFWFMCLQACNRSFQMISAVVEAHKVKKNATMLKRFLPDESSTNTSIFLVCFSDYLGGFLPGGWFICCKFIQLTEWNSNPRICTERWLGDALEQTETLLGKLQECRAFLK